MKCASAAHARCVCPLPSARPLLLGLGHQQTHLLLGDRAGVHHAGNAPVAQHQYPVAQRQQHVQILAHAKHRHAALLLLVQQIVDGVGGIDVQAAHRIGHHQHDGAGGDFAAHQNLLHIAAGQLAHGRGDAGGDDLKFGDDVLRQGLWRAAVRPEEAALLIGTDHHVVHHVHRSHQAHAQAVLRHEGELDAQTADLHGAHLRNILHRRVRRIVIDLAGFLRRQSGDALQQLALAAARHARDAEDLAAHGGKAGVVQGDDALVVDAGHVLHDQARGGIDRVDALNVQLHLLADHHLSQRFHGGLRRFHRADVPALVQHRHAVRNGQHLVELVGDDDNGVARVPHVAQHVEQPVRLLWREHGGGLVQDQYVRAAVEHLHDLHRLLFGDGHLVDLLEGVDLKAVLVRQLADARGYLGNVQLCGAGQAQHDVLRRREHVHQLEMLVDHADAQRKGVLRGADGHLFPVDEDLPLVRVVDAGDHVHQRGLAAAVFSKYGQDLAVAHGQIDPVVGDHLAEPLGDVPQFNGVCISHPNIPPNRLSVQINRYINYSTRLYIPSIIHCKFTVRFCPFPKNRHRNEAQ